MLVLARKINAGAIASFSNCPSVRSLGLERVLTFLGWRFDDFSVEESLSINTRACGTFTWGRLPTGILGESSAVTYIRVDSSPALRYVSLNLNTIQDYYKIFEHSSKNSKKNRFSSLLFTNLSFICVLLVI